MRRLFTWTAMSLAIGSLLALSMAAAQPLPGIASPPVAQKWAAAPSVPQNVKPLPQKGMVPVDKGTVPVANRQAAPQPTNAPGGELPPPAGPLPNPALGRWVLGITMGPVPNFLAYHLPQLLAPKHGIFVATVEPASPADLIGLRRGDVIVRYGQFPTDLPEQLTSFVQASGGRPAQLTVIQAGAQRTIDVTADFRLWEVAHSEASALSISVQTGPGSVSLAGANNRLKLVADFIDDAGQRYHLEKIGSLAGIRPEIDKLPPELAQIVISQLPATNNH
jgi:membrane-associated protease RseP (regulator of RpoE activity)